MSWLEEICVANDQFLKKANEDVFPLEREPCPYAVITCMDPRINLEAIGIEPFTPKGESKSQIRIIRTIGGIHELRSLVIGVHMAGFKELAILMHTDCGSGLAYSNIDKIVANMQRTLLPEKLDDIKKDIGEPFQENLRKWLHAFKDPGKEVVREVQRIKESPFMPEGLIIHGLVYDLATGKIEVAVSGYENQTPPLKIKVISNN